MIVSVIQFQQMRLRKAVQYIPLAEFFWTPLAAIFPGNSIQATSPTIFATIFWYFFFVKSHISFRSRLEGSHTRWLPTYLDLDSLC